MSLRNYLIALKKSLNTLPLRFVTGNQSADMDSVISAFAYAQFNHMYDQTHLIPLINIPRADLRLRRDIVAVLQAHSISEDLLYFTEDFTALSKDKRVDLVLVDHCNIQGTELQGHFNAGLVDVVAIIDHHADEEAFLEANPRVIHSNGSCSSLVFDYWYRQMGSDQGKFAECKDTVQLLVGPLLLDTGNLSDKVEQGDIDAVKVYKDILSQDTMLLERFPGQDISESFTGLFQSLKKAKKDLEGFSFEDILRKDHKGFVFGPYTVGFSSIGKPISWVTKHFTEEQISAALANVFDHEQLSLLVITTSFTRKDNKRYTREFAYYYRAEDETLSKLHQLVDVLELNEDEYNLDSSSVSVKNGVFRVFNQGNTSASRKQVVPAVKNALE